MLYTLWRKIYGIKTKKQAVDLAKFYQLLAHLVERRRRYRYCLLVSRKPDQQALLGAARYHRHVDHASMFAV